MKTLTSRLALAAIGLLAAVTLSAAPAFAAPYRSTYQVASYDEAAGAKTFIRFHMSSTKLGMLTSSFDGYVKHFDLSADVEGTQAGAIRLTFPVRAMDTDIGMRNSKMFDQCLDADRHPTVSVALDAPVPLDGSARDVPATLNVRGKEHPIAVRVSVEQRDGSFVVHGESKLSLAALEVPDPSILIATVDDTVGVQFQLVVSKDALARN